MEKQTAVVQAFDLGRDGGHIKKAARILADGGLVAFPTETVYGIGANALNPEAVRGIFEAKGRPQDNPLIVHVTTLGEMEPLVAEFPDSARRLADAFWPGPLTIILPKTGAVPEVTSGGLDTVAVRMPSHPVARAIIRQSGVPVAAPSANRSGGPSPTVAQHCIFDLSGRVDMILDGGPCEVGVESTVLSLTGRVPRILRPGAVTLAALQALLGPVEVDPAVTHKMDEGQAAASPGMKYRHYAPKAGMVLVHGSDEAFYRLVEEKSGSGVWFLVFDEDVKAIGGNVLSYGSANSSRSQAGRIFSALREIDGTGAEMVYARAPSMEGVGLAVYNRMLRAAAFHEQYL